MADEADEKELVLGEEDELDPVAPDVDPDADPDGDEPDDPDEEETVLLIGDEDAAPASGEGETPLIKHLREQTRRQAKEIAELRKGSQPQKIEVGPKPTLADCDYDEDKFEAELDGWKDRTAQAAKLESEADRQSRELNEDYQRGLQAYQAGKANLAFPDVDDAEETVLAVMGVAQQNVILSVADKPDLVIYALGKNPAKLDELSKIKNPLKLAAAVAKLEGSLKVTTRKKAPAPERIARGSAAVNATGADKTLERLEKEAERTRDRTKVQEYKRQLRTQAKD